MSSYNSITLIGTLKADPTTKKVGKMTKTDFILCCERYMKDKSTYIDEFNIVTWGKLAEVAGSYLNEGSKVLVDGKIQIRTLIEDGARKWITEIVAENLKFMSKKQTNDVTEYTSAKND